MKNKTSWFVQLRESLCVQADLQEIKPKEGSQILLWLSKDMSNKSWIFKNPLWLLPGGKAARLETDTG